MRRQWLFNRAVRGNNSYSTGTASLGVPDTLPNLFAWYRADLGITLNGSNVSAWADQKAPAQDGVQGTAVNQPPWVSSDANFNNNSSIGPFDASNDSINFGSTANEWNFMHDGSGMTVALVFRTGSFAAIRRIFDSQNANNFTRGVSIFTTAATPSVLNVVMGNGSAATVSLSTTASITANTLYRMTFRHQTTQTPDYTMLINGTTRTGNNLAATSSSDASFVPCVGKGVSGGSQPFDGYVAEVIVYNGYLSDADNTTLHTYLSGRYT